MCCLSNDASLITVVFVSGQGNNQFFDCPKKTSACSIMWVRVMQSQTYDFLCCVATSMPAMSSKPKTATPTIRMIGRLVVPVIDVVGVGEADAVVVATAEVVT